MVDGRTRLRVGDQQDAKAVKSCLQRVDVPGHVDSLAVS